MGNFKQWLTESISGIIPFHQASTVDIPPDGVISFDMDGTLTKWNHNAAGWYETPFITVIRDLKHWAKLGHKCIITTHRTKELEGNPEFIGKGRDKMKILDLVQDDVLPISPDGGILYTHMADKGSALINLKKKGLNVVMHYDDEMKNLTSVISVGIIGVKVDPGPSPPKYIVPGDGQH